MSDVPRFLPATSFALDAFAAIFTHSFEAYFYPSAVTAEQLAWRVRAENIDLYRSLVMLLGDEPIGVALLALRGERAWCSGFGVMLPFRGRGLSHPLALALLDQARQAGARWFGLEVLTRNEPAIRTYLRAGLRIIRDLLVLEWQAGAGRGPGGERPEPAVVERAPGELLAHFAALHPIPAAWQRDLPAQLVRAGMRGLALIEADRPTAYLLYRPGEDGAARLMDLGAERSEQAAALLAALQARHMRIASVNEPSDSPFLPAFLAAGFREIDRQHEMGIELASD